MQAANVAEAIARDIAALAAAAASAADCQDDDLRCDGWAVRGECGMNPGFMHRTCRAACGLCRPDAGNQTAPGEGGGKAAEQPKQALEHPDLQQMQQSEPQRALPLLAAADGEVSQQRPASDSEPDQALRRPGDAAGEQAGAQQGAESRAGADPEPGAEARSAGAGTAGGQLASAALSGLGGTSKETWAGALRGGTAAGADTQAEGAEARPASQDSVQAVGVGEGTVPAEESDAREAYAAASGDAQAGLLREPSLASPGSGAEGLASQQAAGEQQPLAGAALATDSAKPRASAGGEGAGAKLGATPSAPANAAALGTRAAAQDAAAGASKAPAADGASAGQSPADLRAAAARDGQARGVAGGDPDAQPNESQQSDGREGASAGHGAQRLQDPGAAADPGPDPEDDPDPMKQSDEELRAAEARAAREEWVARLRESAAASAAAKAAKAGAFAAEDARSAASAVAGSEGGGGGAGGQQEEAAASGAGARAEADDSGDTSGRGGAGRSSGGGGGGSALQRTDLAQSFQAVPNSAGDGGAGSSVRAPLVKVQGAEGVQGARQAEERASAGAALTQTPAQTLSSPEALRHVQAGSQEAEWARLRAAAAAGEDGPAEEHLSPDKRAAMARRGSDGTAQDDSSDRSADRSGEAGSGNQGMLGAAAAGALEAGPLHTPAGSGGGAATQEPAGAAGGGGGDGGYMIATGSRDGLNTLAPLKGAAGAAAALAQAAARLQARLQRACYANPALTMAQVTDCLAEAKRAGAGVLRNPLRAPAHAPARAPVLERRSDDAPAPQALAVRNAVQDSGRAARAHSSRRLRQRGAEVEGFVGGRPPQPPADAWGAALLARLLFSWTGRGVLALGAVVAFLLLLPRGGRRRRHRSRID